MYKKTMIVNLFAGASAGKSTTAAMLFGLLKMNGVDCEMSMEYPKELIWEDKIDFLLNEQWAIFEEHMRRTIRLMNKVEVIVAECPLLLSSFYGRTYKNLEEYNLRKIEKIAKSHYTLDFFIERQFKINPNGRLENTEDSVVNIDQKIKDYLNNLNIGYEIIPGNFKGINKLTNIILGKLNLSNKFNIKQIN